MGIEIIFLFVTLFFVTLGFWMRANKNESDGSENSWIFHFNSFFPIKKNVLHPSGAIFMYNPTTPKSIYAVNGIDDSRSFSFQKNQWCWLYERKAKALRIIAGKSVVYKKLSINNSKLEGDFPGIDLVKVKVLSSFRENNM